MRKLPLPLLALFIAHVPLDAGEQKIGQHVFTVPDGFAIELVAGPPLVDRPIVASLDAAGHLYVADSAGVNDKVERQLEERPHRIVRLSDTDDDGVFDESTVFADRMMFPEGMLWHDGAVYCAAPPSIWKLEDTNGDGVADERTEWFNVGTLTGCANDLHGPYLDPAGWIYWTKGAFARLDLTMADGTRLTDSAAHLFRARPDGSGLESFAAGGMDNPVDITFGEAGDVFFSSTFLVHPGNGQRDGLIHSVYGSVYPKRHGVIDGLPRTGELMPAMTHLGPAAPAGLTTYRSAVFGEEFRGNLFSCLFNMRKVMRHRLMAAGASFVTGDSDFVVSDQVDFHPTDVLEDADGSLLVLDTGGWYKLCCPTSVIAKPEVFGGIYRVRRTGAPKVDDARGAGIDWAGLDSAAGVNLLGDRRPAVRDGAIAAVARLGDDAVGRLRTALTQSDDEHLALGALWTLARIRSDQGAAAVRLALTSPFPAVMQAGAYVCGLERDPESLPGLLALLKSGNPAVRREAATALGRLKNPDACAALAQCAAAEEPGEMGRFLEHAIIYALIEINDPAAVRSLMPQQDQALDAVGLRCLWALDQMKNGGLQPHEVVRQGIGNDSQVIFILKRHPGWEQELAAYYERFLRAQGVHGQGEQGEGRRDHFLGDFLQWPAVARVVSDVLLDDALDPAARGLAAGALAGFSAGDQGIPDALVPGLEKAVTAGLAAAECLRGLRPGQLTPGLEAGLLKQAHAGNAAAIDVLVDCDRQLPPEVIGGLISRIGSGDLDVARALSRTPLTDLQLTALTDALPNAGPVELPVLLGVYRNGGTAELGEHLAHILAGSPAASRLPMATIAELADAFPEALRQKIRDARPEDPGLADVQGKLQKLQTTLPEGDRLRGHQVFKSTKAACATCHRIAYAGGEVGPDLTRIGSIRSRRDLLEAVVAPSASYARGYEPMIVTSNSGAVAVGIVSHSPGQVVVTDVLGQRTAFAASAVKDMQLAPMSLMPAGLDQNLSPQEMADLIVFLESLK